jgi:Na+/proline symporter
MKALSPGILLGIILAYFLMLILVSIFTSRNANNQDFFTAGRNSPWYLVAIGMIGASLSGVTFISIPGVVGGGGLNQAFSYMQIVLGYMLGYAVIALVLLPLYYRMNLTSIYTYLEKRFGWHAYKMGAIYFQLSRTTGSALRLFLVATILHQFVFAPYQISFAFSVFLTIFLIWVYTFKGGIKTIVVTDTIQTFFMLGAVLLTIILICQNLNMGFGDMVRAVNNSGYSKIFFFEGGWSDPNNFFKQFLSGALITLTMTGLDQDMMQKNLTCRTLKDAQKNMFTFSIILVFANLLFLTMGAMLYIYSSELGITLPEKTDQVYPFLALNHLSPFIGILFIL